MKIRIAPGTTYFSAGADTVGYVKYFPDLNCPNSSFYPTTSPQITSGRNCKQSDLITIFLACIDSILNIHCICCLNEETPEEHKEKLRTIIKASMADPESYIEEFKVDVPGKTVYRTIYINGVKTREVKLPIGVETDLPGADGRPYKGKLTFDGETKIRFHQKAADYEADQIFELKGDTILLTLTSGSVSGTHTYQRA